MCKNAINIFLAGLLSLVLVLTTGAGLAIPASQAHADDLSDAQSALDSASKQLDSITSEYERIQSEISSLNQKMSETTTKVMQAQNAMMKGQTVLGDAIKAAYKSPDASLVSVFLMSENMGDFLKNITYYSAIQQDQAEMVADQKELRSQFQDALSELESQKKQQDEMKNQAAAKKAEAEKVVSEASAKVSSIESERARVAELEAKAAELAKEKEEQAQAQIVEGWNTNTDGADSGSSSSDDSSDNSSDNYFYAEPTGSDWQTGVASAYGGSSDPYTPNPGITATGAICDDYSMGVAVPMAWSNYRSLLGHAVEINYNGRSVIATINDCGGMGGGSRSLDLQPGVFKALGFDTCQDWGVRTVSYRIL